MNLAKNLLISGFSVLTVHKLFLVGKAIIYLQTPPTKKRYAPQA